MKRKVNSNLVIGCVLLSLIILMVFVGFFWTPYDPDFMDAAARNTAPNLHHFLGTDHFGRDVLSRVMAGAGTTFLVGAATVLIGLVFGTLIGAVTGYFGGIVDEILMRLNDGLAAFPSILLALVFVSLLGTGKYKIIFALGVIFIPSFARVVRSEFIAKKNLDYVTNAKLMGAGGFRIMFFHILPNLRGILLSSITIAFNNAVLAEAGLSFLSLGVQPPDASLGRMLAESQGYLLNAPWHALAPGLTIVIAILSVSLISSVLEEEGPAGIVWPALSKPEIKPLTNQENRETPLLSVSELSVFFAGSTGIKPVVDHLSFSIEKGEIVGIVGESGSGKSMTAYSIMGLLPEDAKVEAGSICFDGQNINLLPEEDFGKLRGYDLTMVFQEPMTSLNPVLKIGYQVEEVLKIHEKQEDHNGVKTSYKQCVLDALTETGLEDAASLYHKYPHELSGGMRQRVMIAIAMICKPKLLIADEPTTALDATVQSKILSLLKMLSQKYGTAILLISHDLNVIRSICTRTLVMKEGRMVEEGLIHTVFQNPASAYTKLLMEASAEKLRDPAKSDRNSKEKDRVILSLEHVNIYYIEEKKYRHQVGKDLTFTVKKGEIFGIVGESGSGKSSLVKAILGLSEDMEGKIELTGSQPQMVFQDPYGSLNPVRRIGWILEEPLKVKGGYTKEERKKQVCSVLSKVGLPFEFAARKVSELSGGQRQRVAIALAIILRQDLIVLDEPVSALDVTIQAQILKLLLQLRDDLDMTYLFISHDMDVVRRVCDRLCVIYNGEIVEIGTIEEIFQNPKHFYTKELLANRF